MLGTSNLGWDLLKIYDLVGPTSDLVGPTSILPYYLVALFTVSLMNKFWFIPRFLLHNTKEILVQQFALKIASTTHLALRVWVH